VYLKGGRFLWFNLCSKKENPDIMNGAQLHAEGLDDDRDLADMAAKKDRDWDDYKDENVKGAGVTKRY